MNITEEIKNIILKYIEKEYQKYLQEHKILLIKETEIKTIITELYDNNSRSIKSTIRSSLKEKYKEEYPNASVENIIFDIFQDKNLNVNKIVDEIIFIQKKNYKSFTIPIIENNLNINISIIENYVVINAVNNKNIDLYNDLYSDIIKYKFIYSVNNKILDDYCNVEKINIIKEEINNKTEIEIGLYYLKQN